MIYIDTAYIFISSGDGGDGINTWYTQKTHNKNIPFGGNGGNGGNIIFISDHNKNSLIDFFYNNSIKAENGKIGQTQKKNGTRGRNTEIFVPPGTQIVDNFTNKIIANLDDSSKKILICKGGRGGKGNAYHSKNTQILKDYLHFGRPGKTMSIKLVLKSIAQIGLIGFPNSGKSTFLTRISQSKPNIANYPFTTLKAQLGIYHSKKSKYIIIADIPGIIKESSFGIGLGNYFLKNIKKIKIICHIIPASNSYIYSTFQYILLYKELRHEILYFSENMSKIPELFIFSKIDILKRSTYSHKIKEFMKYIYPHKIINLSSISGYGVNQISRLLIKLIYSLN